MKINYIILPFLIFVLGCGNLEVEKDFDLDGIKKYLGVESVKIGKTFVYEKGEKKKFISIDIESCESCFAPYSHPYFTISNVALAVKEQGILDYDGIIVHAKFIDKDGGIIETEGEIPNFDMNVVKRLAVDFKNTQFPKKEFSNDLCVFDYQTGSASFSDFSDFINGYNTVNSMGFVSIKVNGDVERFKYAIAYRVRNNVKDDLGVLINIYDKNQKLESIIYSKEYDVSIFDNFGKIMEKNCGLFNPAVHHKKK